MEEKRRGCTERDRAASLVFCGSDRRYITIFQHGNEDLIDDRGGDRTAK